VRWVDWRYDAGADRDLPMIVIAALLPLILLELLLRGGKV
jgi:hypothetical protein